MFRRHPVLAPLTLLYLGLVAWLTLGPQPLNANGQRWLDRAIAAIHAHANGRWPRLIDLITYQHIEFWANIVMFIPVGIFFLLLFGRRLWWLAILLCFAMTAAIEFSQEFIPGRVSDVRDLESNGMGAVLGVLVGLVLTIPGAMRERERRRMRELEAQLAGYEHAGSDPFGF